MNILKCWLLGPALLTALSVAGQNLHFKSTAPAWVDGAHSNNYTQIGTPAVDVGVSLASTGSGNFTLGTPKGVSTGLQVAVNFATTSDTKVITITFAQGVQNLSFSIYGIDKNATSQDQVTINGKIGRRISDPTLTPSAYVTQSGNTLTGTSDDPGSAASGVVFSGYVDQVTVVFGCGPAANANPGAQGITIGHLNWAGPLPVELISFSAKPVGNSVQLTWTTAWERNAQQFIVQRSQDLNEFNAIGSLPARGTTEQRQIYTLTDEWPLDGTNYYRLRQVDSDGQVTYSKPVAATSGDTAPALELVENPVDGQEIRAHVRNMAGSTYRLMTLSGHESPVRVTTGSDGILRLTLLRPLLPGTYWLCADTANQRLTRPVVIR